MAIRDRAQAGDVEMGLLMLVAQHDDLAPRRVRELVVDIGPVEGEDRKHDLIVDQRLDDLLHDVAGLLGALGTLGTHREMRRTRPFHRPSG